MNAIYTTTIDHPLAPEHAYLTHALIAAPEPLTTVSGTLTLDEAGAAVVSLPVWFEALTRDLRYQVTPLGAPAPNLYIAQELHQAQFTIAGGSPRLKVSWQVSGVRQDPYVQAHPIEVEAAKPRCECGTYLHPEEYGQPTTKGREYARMLWSWGVPMVPTERPS